MFHGAANGFCATNPPAAQVRYRVQTERKAGFIS
jgi:hypothetical protein